MFFNHTIGQEEHTIQLVLLQNKEGQISAFQFYFPRKGTKNTLFFMNQTDGRTDAKHELRRLEIVDDGQNGKAQTGIALTLVQGCKAETRHRVQHIFTHPSSHQHRPKSTAGKPKLSP